MAATLAWIKDPDAVLDYAFDWTDWLSEGETISSHTIVVGTITEDPTPLLLDSDSEAAGVVTAWLSGGTVGKQYTVACRIATAQGRTDERSRSITVRNR